VSRTKTASLGEMRPLSVGFSKVCGLTFRELVHVRTESVLSLQAFVLI